METNAESENLDSLSDFCQRYILSHRQDWPTDELELASSFVQEFKLPVLTDVSAFDVFTAQSKIELIERDIPPNLLGLNMCFEGVTKIWLSRHPDHTHFRMHTILHEIREVIESRFRSFGFRTTNQSDLDNRADQFAFAAFMFAGRPIFKDFVENACRAEPGSGEFLEWGVICLLGIAFGLFSFLGAYGYRHLAVREALKVSPRIKRACG